MQFTAKTPEEAISLGLKEMGLSQEQAEITVIQEAVKGLFGRVKTPAIVEITKKEEPKKKTKKQKVTPKNEGKQAEIISKILELLGVDFEIEESVKDEKQILNIISSDSSFIIGYRGEVLDALQTIAGAYANIGKDVYQKIVVDCEGYREKREATLVNLAHKLEQKATEIRREVQLEPMCAFERRIIHTALAESQTVTTKSDGKEPERFVVIVPNDKDEYSKPYNAGRNHGSKNNGGKKDYKKSRDRRPQRKSGFTENKRVAPSGFGTYLGNSLKDKI